MLSTELALSDNISPLTIKIALKNENTCRN